MKISQKYVISRKALMYESQSVICKYHIIIMTAEINKQGILKLRAFLHKDHKTLFRFEQFSLIFMCKHR